LARSSSLSPDSLPKSLKKDLASPVIVIDLSLRSSFDGRLCPIESVLSLAMGLCAEACCG
jgi:hypothetical protein